VFFEAVPESDAEQPHRFSASVASHQQGGGFGSDGKAAAGEQIDAG
jgi:hypothetical protein